MRPKLEVMGSLLDHSCEARCVEVDCKRQRRMLLKLRGGTTQIYMARRRCISVRCVAKEKWKMWSIFYFWRKEMVRVIKGIMEG